MSELSCLNCQSPLEADFGIVACLNCGTVMMVDLDGRLQLAEESNEPAPLPIEQAEVSPESDTGEAHEASPIDESPELNTPDLASFDEPLSFEAPADSEIPGVSGSEMLKEIQEYANSEVETSGMSYDLVIADIDSADLRSQVLDLLKELKIKSRQSELQVQGGRLELLDLNPAMASVVVTQFQSLRVSVSWRQKRYEA